MFSVLLKIAFDTICVFPALVIKEAGTSLRCLRFPRAERWVQTQTSAFSGNLLPGGDTRPHPPLL